MAFYKPNLVVAQ